MHSLLSLSSSQPDSAIFLSFKTTARASQMAREPALDGPTRLCAPSCRAQSWSVWPTGHGQEINHLDTGRKTSTPTSLQKGAALGRDVPGSPREGPGVKDQASASRHVSTASWSRTSNPAEPTDGHSPGRHLHHDPGGLGQNHSAGLP